MKVEINIIEIIFSKIDKLTLNSTGKRFERSITVTVAKKTVENSVIMVFKIPLYLLVGVI
jgi:hypothetical protein